MNSLSGNIKICITGAGGNLGGLLAEYLIINTQHSLNLLIHKKNVSEKLLSSPKTTVYKGDLNNKESLVDCLHSVDVVIHFAGVLFKGKPEKFLPTTNVQYFKNLCDVAIKQNVKRIVLVSFPHVEGETTAGKPAQGSLDKIPISIHATTRLQEEKYLFEATEQSQIEAVSLRVGMVYGKGVLMIDVARWLSKWWLLGIWKEKTWIHLISKDDFLESTKNAIIKNNISGIFHIGDEGVQTLQEFFTIATSVWGYKRPWIMPNWMISFAAQFMEFQSILFGTKAILTKDFITIGKVSYYGDTSRMRKELLLRLKFKTIHEGKDILL